MEAYEGYWRKMPSVKRLVFKSVPEATTRMAMLKRGEVDLAYLLDAPQALELKRDPKFKLAFSGGIGTFYLDFFDSGIRSRPGTTGGCGWRPATRSTARRSARPRRSAPRARPAAWSRASSSSRCRSSPTPTTRRKAKQLLAEAGYPNGFDAGDLYPGRPTSRRARRSAATCGAVGIKIRVRTMERAAFYAALATKKLQGLCVCINAVYGNAASRMSETVPSDGAYAYGGYPDVDALYKQQARETDREARGAAAPDPAARSTSACASGRSMDYIWPSGVGPAGGGAGADADRSVSRGRRRSKTSGSRSRRPAPARRAGTG